MLNDFIPRAVLWKTSCADATVQGKDWSKFWPLIFHLRTESAKFQTEKVGLRKMKLIPYATTPGRCLWSMVFLTHEIQNNTRLCLASQKNFCTKPELFNFSFSYTLAVNLIDEPELFTYFFLIWKYLSVQGFILKLTLYRALYIIALIELNTPYLCDLLFRYIFYVLPPFMRLYLFIWPPQNIDGKLFVTFYSLSFVFFFLLIFGRRNNIL